MNPRSTDYNVDALTTAPSRRLKDALDKINPTTINDELARQQQILYLSILSFLNILFAFFLQALPFPMMS